MDTENTQNYLELCHVQKVSGKQAGEKRIENPVAAYDHLPSKLTITNR